MIKQMGNLQIPLVNLEKQYRTISAEIQKSIMPIIKSGRFIQGKEVQQFEVAFASYCNAKYCIGVGSGTDALVLGIRALGIGKGDEVIVPVNTFIATAIGVTENGAQPVFVDCDLNDYGIDLKDLERKITNKTKAVIAVHLYGQPDKLTKIKSVIKKSGKKIVLIEDACQAHGAYFKNRRVGSYGIFSAFSFYPGKNLGAFGDGGAVITNSKKLYNKVRLLREYGQLEKYKHTILGTNSRLDTIQAGVLQVKLSHLDKWNTQRQVAAQYYSKKLKKLSKYLELPKVYQYRKSVYHLYLVRVKNRDKLLKYLQSNGIQALIHYPLPLHLQKAFSYMKSKRGDLPNAEKLANQILSLPIYPEITKKEINYITQTILKFYIP